jgi:hypothetical protein
VNLSSASWRHAVAPALLTAVLLAVGVSRADGATLRSAAFSAPTLKTRWALDSGDCASVLSISRARKVDSYGYFTRRHFTWSVSNCLAVSNARTLTARAGTYYLRGHALPPATYYVQLQYCHDSDFSKRGNYYCRGSNVESVHIPGAAAR